MNARTSSGVQRWLHWVALCTRAEDPLSVAVVRIVVAMTVALHVVHLAASGALPLVWLDQAYGGLRLLDGGILKVLGGARPEVVYPLAVGTVVSAAAMALGLGRWTTWATWLGFSTLADLNGQAGGSYDELLTSTLFLLGFSGAHGRLTLVNHAVPVRSLACVRWLLVLQLVLMYTSSGIQKVSTHWVPWGDHMALWYILQQPTWQRASMLWLAPVAALTRLATVISWFFEVLAGVLILAAWFRHTRTRAGRLRALFNRLDIRVLYLAIGVGMHLGIEVTMEVGAFCAATLALYAACFAPDEIQRVFTKSTG